MARAAVIPATSPPKRGARTTKRTTTKTTTTSRSATSGVTKPNSRTRTATASTVASQARRGVRSTPKPTNDNNTDNETDDEIGVIEQQKPKTTMSKPRGRPPATTSSTGTSRGRKVTAAVAAVDTDDSEEDELAQVEEAPKKQAGRPKKQMLKEEAAPKSESAPRPRGRPKGSTNKTTKTTTAGKESLSRSRARAGTDVNSAGDPKEVFITTNSTMMKSNLLRGPAKKKKVTFQDMSDSEDMREPSPPPAGRKRATTSARQTGLAAKPARKTTTTSARGRKPAATKKTASKPLSPKKATQVAKSLSSYVSSDGEDDELSGAKSPIKLVVHSPQKHGSETTGLSSPVKRINFTTAQSPKNVDENGEPVPRPRRSIDFNDTAFMSSPARRPTPSPFNYTIRETPRRAGIALRDDAKPIAQPDFTPMQESPLKLSPKKANLGTPRLGSLSVPDNQPLSQPGHNSPLKSSPKKGLFGSSFMSQAIPQESSTPFKSRSLLMSPAKKIASPFKSSIFGKSYPLPESPRSAEKEQEPDAANVEPVHESPLQGVERDEESEGNDDMIVQNTIDQDPEEMEADYPSEDEGHEHDLILDADIGADDQPPSDVQEDQPQYLQETGTEGDMTPTDDPEPASIDHYDTSHDEPESDEESENEKESDFQELELNGQLDNKEGDFQGPMDVFEEETAPLEHDASDENGEKLAESEGHFETTEAINELPEDVIPDNGEEDYEHEEAVTDTQAAQGAQEHAETFQKESSHVSDEEQLNYLGDGPESEANTPPGSPLRHNMAGGLEDPFTDEYVATEPWVIAQEVEDDEEPAPAGDGGCDDNLGTEEDRTTTCETNQGESLLVFDATEDDASQPQALTPYEIDERRDSIASQNLQHYLPSAPSPPKPTGYLEYRDPEGHTESIMEDTMSVTEPTTKLPTHAEKEPIPLTESQLTQRPERRRSTGPRFTLLAEQLSGWKASSPEKSEKARPRKRGVFSLAGNLKRPSDAFSVTSDVTYPALSLEEPPLSIDSQEHQVEDEGPTIFEDQHAEPDTIEDDIKGSLEHIRPPLFEIFGDAQADASKGGMEHTPAASSKGNSPVCSPPSLHEATMEEEKENQNILLPTPATPAKNIGNQMHTFHTVSKVPLKPEGQISPLKMPRKRGHSLSTASPLRSSPRIRNIIATREQNLSASPSSRPQRVATPQLKSSNSSRVRRSVSRHSGVTKAASRSPSPSKTPARNISACEQVLRGAVVYVDVHTTEGEDASGIFVELLSQMGARCVKNWAWNPRASLCPQDEQEPKDGRIGITHVVYKDGGVRTLEKVRQAGGVVKCVGVGWVLDCERANKWLDETHYAVDSSIIPRGGAKRRKSMEPRALSNVNGTLVKTTTTSASANSRRSGADWDTVEDFMRHTPPPREESTSSATPESSRKFRHGHPEADQEYCQTPKTPGSSAYDFANLDRIGMSPATPFYLSQRSRLVQQTCPAKQTRQGLFSTLGQTTESSNPLRARLEAARRQSLAFKPRIGSPLIE